MAVLDLLPSDDPSSEIEHRDEAAAGPADRPPGATSQPDMSYEDPACRDRAGGRVDATRRICADGRNKREGKSSKKGKSCLRHLNEIRRRAAICHTLLWAGPVRGNVA